MQDEEEETRILRDLAVIHSCTSSNQDRNLAQMRCDSIRDSMEKCLGFGLKWSCDAGKAVFVRHFGMQLLACAIAAGYCTVEHILTLVSCINDGDEKLIKEKVCWLWCELAKRIWPVRWPNMDIALRELYANSSKKCNPLLVLAIYKRLVQDTFLFDDPVTMSRKLELSTSLLTSCVDATSLDSWIEKERAADPSFDSFKGKTTDLDALLRFIRADPSNIGWMSRFTRGLSGALVNGSFDLVQAHMETIDVFLKWIPVSSIQESQIHILLFDLAASPDLRFPPAQAWAIKNLTIECLLSLSERNFRPVDSDIRHSIFWAPLFSQFYLERIILFWRSIHGQSSSSESTLSQVQQHYIPDSEFAYLFMKKMAQFLGLVASSHICYKRNADKVPHNFNVLLEFLLVLTTHPSAYVSCYALDSIFDCIRHEFIKTVILVEPCAVSIIDYLTTRLGGKPNLDPKTAEAYFVLDFDSKRDESMARAHNNLRRAEIIRILAAADSVSVPVFDWVDGQVRLLLGQVPCKFTIVQLSICLEAVLGAIPVALIKDEKTRNMHLFNSVYTLLDGILTLDARDVEFVAHQLPMIASFSPFMDVYPTLLFRCMEKFFSFAAFTQPDEYSEHLENVKLSDATMLVRRKAASALVKLGSSMPDTFIPIIDQISPAILSLANNGRLLKTESRLVIEFLIDVISGSKLLDGAKKAKYLSTVLQSQFAALENFTGPLSSMENFYQIMVPFPAQSWANEVAPSPQVIAQFEQLDRWRRDFLNEILSFRHWIKKSHDVAKRTQADINLLWQPYIPKLLSICLSLISNIQALWVPDTWNGVLPEKLKKITTLTPFEKVMAIGGDSEGVKDLNSSETANPLDEQIFRLWSWVGRAREACYQFFSVIMLFPCEFYESGAVPDLFMTSLFANPKSISLHHWRSLLTSTMIPFILQCPVHLYATVLGPLLPALTLHLNEQLSAVWTPENVAKLSLPGAHDDGDEENLDVSDEVIFEKVLRSFTRSISELWSSIFSLTRTPGSVMSQSSTTFRYQELVQFCFSNPSLVQQWTGALVMLLSVKDTAACHQALKTCLALVTPLSSDASAHPFLGQVLLKAVLGVFTDGYQKSNHAEAIHLIIDIYTTLRPLTDIPYFTLAQINGMEADKLNKFESELLAETNMKTRTILAKTFLAAFHGLEVSEWGRERVADFGHVQEKKLFSKTEKDTGRANILDSEDAGQSVLGLSLESSILLSD